MKVSELSGALLALWVARAQGRKTELRDGEWFVANNDGDWMLELDFWKPHEDWAQGGPLIEKHLITVTPEPYDDGPTMRLGWLATIAIYGIHNHPAGEPLQAFRGKTPLIAAMRAYVASVYGAEVPDEVAT